MIEKEVLRELVKKYFSESTDKQINDLLEELMRDIEVMTCTKTRDGVGY